MINDRVRKWIIKAMEDFKVSQHELSLPDEEISTGPVCFHCQQVVEKLLKAYLVFKNIEFEWTHDLEHLLDLCSKCDPEFKNLDVGTLTSYAVEVRYPDEFYIPTVDEARECFDIASKVKDFVSKKMKIKEGNQFL